MLSGERGVFGLVRLEPRPNQPNALDHAFHSLLAYGAQAEVLAPQALRERIAAAAAETSALYADAGA